MILSEFISFEQVYQMSKVSDVMQKNPFIHKVIVDATNKKRIIRFTYAGDMRKLRNAIIEKMSDFEVAFYVNERGSRGRIIAR